MTTDSHNSSKAQSKWRVYGVKHPMDYTGSKLPFRKDWKSEGWFWVHQGHSISLFIRVHGLDMARWLCRILNRHETSVKEREMLASADSEISTCDDCGAPMPIVYEGDGGSTYCAKCAGVVEMPKMFKRSDARWWSGVPMTDNDVWECAITGGWTPSNESSVSDAINFLAKNGHKIYKLNPPNDK